jgi:hypothetical protein
MSKSCDEFKELWELTTFYVKILQDQKNTQKIIFTMNNLIYLRAWVSETDMSAYLNCYFLFIFCTYLYNFEWINVFKFSIIIENENKINYMQLWKD